jgi:hypothetical protein
MSSTSLRGRFGCWICCTVEDCAASARHVARALRTARACSSASAASSQAWAASASPVPSGSTVRASARSALDFSRQAVTS